MALSALLRQTPSVARSGLAAAAAGASTAVGGASAAAPWPLLRGAAGRRALPVAAGRVGERRTFASSASEAAQEAVEVVRDDAMARRSMSPAAMSPRIRYKKNKYCPECGKRAVAGETEEMREACSRMWRKYMRLGDLHCPLFLTCQVKENEGHDEEHHLWKAMPRLKGRS
eukprot:TRINITY_DN2117_c0_g1_i3.p1 TRINITY_DN2117_c0_g1~~TRINITY_DN2117_c0_g1_i3.p1  ORF type:complete len:183 (-),score=38.11 TRINITY_DN2117_c0_g1_i3:63-575(-)